MLSFQSVDRARRLTGQALQRREVLAMIKRRAADAELPPSTCCHTFRATGITTNLTNGGTLEHAQEMAVHASPKTTKLYDRTRDTISLDEIERMVIEDPTAPSLGDGACARVDVAPIEWDAAVMGRAQLVAEAPGAILIDEVRKFTILCCFAQSNPFRRSTYSIYGRVHALRSRRMSLS
jgi:hypothetical protein